MTDFLAKRTLSYKQGELKIWDVPADESNVLLQDNMLGYTTVRRITQS